MHSPMGLVARAKAEGQEQSAESARASLQRNAKTNARVNGQWAHWDPIGAGAARPGRGTAATRTGVSSPAPLLPSWTVGSVRCSWAGEVRMLAWYLALALVCGIASSTASPSLSFSSRRLLLLLLVIQLTQVTVP